MATEAKIAPLGDDQPSSGTAHFQPGKDLMASAAELSRMRVSPKDLRLTVEPQADCARYDRLRQPEVSHAR